MAVSFIQSQSGFPTRVKQSGSGRISGSRMSLMCTRDVPARAIYDFWTRESSAVQTISSPTGNLLDNWLHAFQGMSHV